LFFLFFCFLANYSEAKNCLSRLNCATVFNDACIYTYVKVDQVLNTRIARELTTFTRETAPSSGGVDSRPHSSGLGVSYQPGTGVWAQTFPSFRRLVERNNGRWTPFTWKDKNGTRFDFDPIQAIYQKIQHRVNPEKPKEFTMLSSMLNPLDGTRLSIYTLTAAVLGGSRMIVQHDEEESLEEGLDWYPFLESLKQEKEKLEQVLGDSKSFNSLEAEVIKDIAVSPIEFDKLMKQYQGVVPDYTSLAAKLKKELQGLDLDGLDAYEKQFAQMAFLLKMDDSLLGLNVSEKMALEMLRFGMSRPSFLKIKSILFHDVVAYKRSGFALDTSAALGAASTSWDAGDLYLPSFMDSSVLSLLGQTTEDLVAKNKAILKVESETKQQRTRAAWIALKKIELDFERRSFEKMGIVPIKRDKTSGELRPLSDQEHDEIEAQALLKAPL